MMGAFLWLRHALQWRLDIRSRTLLITRYVVPLFFAMMGGILHRSTRPRGNAGSVHDGDGCSMGALIGLPPSLVEIYGSDIKNAQSQRCAAVLRSHPGARPHFHLMLMSAVIYLSRCLHSARRRPPTRQRISVPGGFYCRVAGAWAACLGWQ